MRSTSAFAGALPSMPGPSKIAGRSSKRGSDRNVAQPVRRQLAFAERGVTVDVGAQRGLGVVDVQRAETLEADDRGALVDDPASDSGVRTSKPDA